MIDISSIDRSRFDVREFGKHTLITRNRGLNYDYQPGEHHLRSIVVETETGKVVSSGFPKFFNYGEDKATDRVFKNAKNIWYANKFDGSLIIVSPQEEAPAIIRTRGTYTLPEGFEQVYSLVYKWSVGKMLEPERFGKISFLFEYVGPENRIVLPYKESEIVYLGWIDHDDFEFRPWLGQKPCQDLDTLVSEISKASIDEAGEGVVAYCEDENGRLHMCKIKTAEYLALHRLRFNMTDKKLRALTAFKGFDSVESARDYIEREIGLDFECVNASVIEDTIRRIDHAFARRREFMAYCGYYEVLGQRHVAMAAKEFDSDLWSYLMHAEFFAQGLSATYNKAKQALVAYAAGMSYRKVEALVGEL